MFDGRSRARAALIHLAGSACIALIAAMLVFKVWYPWPYTSLAGGSTLFVLITAVDVVMGPLITFAVFDRRKPRGELRRDLAIVVALQLAALGYGLYVMYSARPVALALEPDRFRVVTALDVARDELAAAPAGLGRLSITGPVILRAEAPTDPGEQLEAIERALGGQDIGARPRYWRAWNDEARRATRASLQPLETLRLRYPQRGRELDAAIARSGRPAAQLGYLPIFSHHADWVALIDRDTGDVVGFAPFDAF